MAAGGLLVGLVFGLGVELGSGLLFGLVSGLDDQLSIDLFNGLTVKEGGGLLVGGELGWLLAGLVLGLKLVSGLIFRLKGHRQPGGVRTWSWKKVGWMAVGGLLVGYVFGLGVELGSDLVIGPIVKLGGGLAFGLGLGWLLAGLVGGLAFGFSSNQLEEHLRLRPNQGIWRSVGNGLLVMLFRVLFFGLVFGLVYVHTTAALLNSSIRT